MKITISTYIRQSIVLRNLSFDSTPNQVAELLEIGFVNVTEREGTYTINVSSDAFINSLISVAEEDLREDCPLDIVGCFEFISRYETWLKATYDNNSYDAFDFLIQPFKVYALIKIYKGNYDDLMAFYNSYAEDDETAVNELWRFPEYFFAALLQLDIDDATICNILMSENKQSEQQRTSHEKSQFVIKLSDINFSRALRLYKFGKVNGLETKPHFWALLLAGLHNNGWEDAENSAKEIFEKSQNVTVIFLGAIKIRTSELIDYTIELFNRIDRADVNLIQNYIYTLHKLIQATISTPDEPLAGRIFHIYFEMLQSKIDYITNDIVITVSRFIKGYEDQKYAFLKASLKHQLIKKESIKDYFNQFLSPLHFFDLFTTTYAAIKGRTDVQLFKPGFDHFLRVQHAQTEREILNLLCHENIHLRTGVIKLWVNSRSRNRQLNLLLLNTEVEQLRAIEGIIKFPFGVNDLLPLILPLRKSVFPNVVLYLQQSLCLSVYEGYHNYLFKLIEQGIEQTKADKKFLKPIKKSLSAYENLKAAKKIIKDIDPWSNEKALVQLYFKLEEEKKAESVQNIEKEGGSGINQIASRSIQIVRGNAWKIEEQGVLGLGKIEVTIPVDSRMYKNPDQFELNLNFPKADF